MKKREQMSINRWTHGRLPCTIYSGGSVSVYCQKLDCFSIDAHVHSHTHTLNQLQQRSFFFWELCLSQWGYFFMAAFKSKKVGTSQMFWLTSPSEPTGDIGVGMKTYAGTCLCTQSCFIFKERKQLSEPKNMVNSLTPYRAEFLLILYSFCRSTLNEQEFSGPLSFYENQSAHMMSI